MLRTEMENKMKKMRLLGKLAITDARMEITCNVSWKLHYNINESALLIAKSAKNIANKLTEELDVEMEVIEIDRPGLFEYKISEADENNFLITFQVIKDYETNGAEIKLSYYHGKAHYEDSEDKETCTYLINVLDDVIAAEFDK